MRLYLAHGVEHYADNDQQAGATEKLRRDGRNVQSLAHEAGQNRYQRKKNRAGEREPRHGEIKKIGSRFSGPDSGNVTTVFFQVIRDLRWLKLGRNPEIAEEEDHAGKDDIMRPSVGKRAGDLRGCRTVFKCEANDRSWKEEQRPGEDNGHHAGVIYFQRHVLGLSAVHFSPDDTLCILDRDLANTLGNRNYGCDDNKQERHHEHQDRWVDLTGSRLR